MVRKPKILVFWPLGSLFFFNVGCSILPWLSLTSNTPLYLHCLIDVLHSRGKIEHFKSFKKINQKPKVIRALKNLTNRVPRYIYCHFSNFLHHIENNILSKKGTSKYINPPILLSFYLFFSWKKWLWSCNKKSVKHCSYCFSIRKEKEIKLLDEKTTTMTARIFS
jgi:hypothetical protein